MSAANLPSSRLESSSPRRNVAELFLASVLLLFLELACIRWFPAHVLFLTFFTNTVLLACFVGMSIGCLAAGMKRNYLAWTPILLGIGLAAAHGIELVQARMAGVIAVGNQASPQLVFFGTDFPDRDVASFVIPIEVLAGFFFVIIALAMMGPGQELGRALQRIPERLSAYTINIAGSIVGIVLFAACSWWELTPGWWFLAIVALLAYFLWRLRPGRGRLLSHAAILGLIVLNAAHPFGTHTAANGQVREFAWSPYYRIDYDQAPTRGILVNLLGHQQMVGRSENDRPSHAYALPYLLERDAQRLAGQEPRPLDDMMIIGAGSGNDLSRALQWGAKHIDAVEIDPVIQRLGARDHPDRAYQDPRVELHLDDGRNFLHSTERKYDLIVYALVDSLVLHSSYSNIRLESYLFTTQAFEDIRAHLKPGGKFVMYNYFRQGWIVARLHTSLQKVFGADPLVLTLPYQEIVDPEQGFGGFTMFLAGEEGATQHIQQAFASRPEYWLAAREAPSPQSPNGFMAFQPEKPGDWARFGLATVQPCADAQRAATDDWPFLYLRRPMIPDLSLRGMAIMGSLALVLLWLFGPVRRGNRDDRHEEAQPAVDARMFFLGAGFMLIETKAVVHMALLFGSAWMVNSVVFFAVLIMILVANAFVLKFKPKSLGIYYAGLFAAIALNALVPLDFFLGMNRTLQVAGSCLLVFAPIAFAGVIFAVSFSRATRPDRAFGANIAGAMLGGLAENTSMLLGFRYLVLVALAFYALSALRVRLPGWSKKAVVSHQEDLAAVS
jgi:SAM-dependent methyltransferase